MKPPAPVKWSAAVIVGFVLGAAASDAYERVRTARRIDAHETRLHAEETTSGVVLLQIRLMQKQLDEIDRKLDAVLARR